MHAHAGVSHPTKEPAPHLNACPRFSISIPHRQWYIQPVSQVPVAIRIGGQTYRVRAQASEQQLQRLAASVDARLRQLTGSMLTSNPQHALLLVAISLAHELDTERAAHKKLQRDTTEVLQALLDHVDHTLALAEASLASLPEPANDSNG